MKLLSEVNVNNIIDKVAAITNYLTKRMFRLQKHTFCVLSLPQPVGIVVYI